jgi:PEP-CTERM motif
MLNKSLMPSVVAFALLLSTPSFATSIDFIGEGKSAPVTIHSPSLGVLSTDAGELNWMWVGPPPAGQPASFYTYCVDPNHYLLDPQSVDVSTSDFMTVAGVADAGGKAAWLIDTYAPSIHQSGSGADAAALQVAIWEAISDDMPNLAAGLFSLIGSPTIAAAAQGYLDALFSAPGGYYVSTATWFDAPIGRGQDQMTPGSPTQVAAVPEPASLLLCGSGFIVIARRLRRNKLATASV